MPSYDVHQHLWPEQLISALSRRKQLPLLRGGRLELAEGVFEVDLEAHRLERRLEDLDRDGIDVACISLPPTLGCDTDPELVAAYHEGIEEVVKAASGRLRAFACNERRHGFIGACVSAHRVVDGVDDLARELAEHDEVLFVHPGEPTMPPVGRPPWWTAVVDYTAQMQAAYSAWLARGEGVAGPSVVFAFLAGGGPFQLERLASRGGDPAPALADDVYLDTASYGPRALELCIDAVGTRQLLFGSDVPILDAAPTLQALSDLGDAVVDAVCRENPDRLLA